MNNSKIISLSIGVITLAISIYFLIEFILFQSWLHGVLWGS